MTRTRRIVATLVATTALAVPTTLTMSTAEAKPSATKTVKSQAKQLLKDVAREDRQLVRLAGSHRVTGLADATEAALVANLTEARSTLAEVEAAVEAADSTVDTKAARKELRSFRVQNFKHAAHVLVKVEDLTGDAAADPEAQAFLAQAAAAALAVTATSTKAEVKAAKAHLASATAELEGAESDDEVVTPTV
ncbi:MAG: hypothetical protein AVDCRST_MAG32-1922 [uncultured Nocardioides sp.]|uniref:Uncharacterized protein n=1 Tax=uncultured Nocardioides sp. TaxID=198441 RepID=A0A6J4NCZ6_9ACTN|nr:MAG: hypothetical protein AVDCRST_MAG32-1922 [uncultured Nocardioides sp.]